VGALVVAVAFVVALVATPLARRAAFAWGVLDQPGPLKLQREAVPYLGGLAILAALTVVLAPAHAYWLLPLAMAAMLGVADDVRARSPRLRLGAQIAIGCVAGLVSPADVRFGFVVTALLVVVCINAVNLIDGMDALASAIVMLAAVGFVIVGGDARILALALCGALAGFLVFNRPPARIYLGDGGSYLLGTALGLLAACMFDATSGAAWVALPFLVGLPLADTAIAIVRRSRSGKPIMHGDRAHVYDQLADRGWPTGRVLAACVIAQLAATTFGLAVLHLQRGTAVIAATGAVAACALLAWRNGFVTREATS
jgi:UDP-GlcNAc:undecaprenyl-phosphate/decaprenyl-phosphate GlcNAc-1-phosphate transferase